MQSLKVGALLLVKVLSMEFKLLIMAAFVDEGDHINIWEDPWIPTSQTRKFYTTKGYILLNKILDLITLAPVSWDEELVRDFFGRVYVNRILEIPSTP
jgi:hypothetical protein